MSQKVSLKIKRAKQFIGSAVKTVIMADGKEVASLKNGQSQSITLEPGNYELCIQAERTHSEIFTLAPKGANSILVDFSFQISSHLKLLGVAVPLCLLLAFCTIQLGIHYIGASDERVIYVFILIAFMLLVYPLIFIGYYLDKQPIKGLYKVQTTKTVDTEITQEFFILGASHQQYPLKVRIFLWAFMLVSPFLVTAYAYSLPFLFESGEKLFRHLSSFQG